MRYILIASLSVLLSLCAHAQDRTTEQRAEFPFGQPYWASASDSADYSHFRQGLTWAGPVPSTDTTTTLYRQVWVESLHGGIAMIARGDGSVMPYRADQVIGWFDVIPFRLADGRRGLTVSHETPCGLICRDTVYYVED
ncbi:MAG: hypothetical protein IT229_00685 [Flavobacteriales bacterium]|nr:hypothetical protein [Flavobacteriales bacterium]